MSDSTWFHRGKEARASGKPRDLVDSRVTPANRVNFQLGWDEQDRLTRPVLTDSQRAVAVSVTRRLKAFAETL